MTNICTNNIKAQINKLNGWTIQHTELADNTLFLHTKKITLIIDNPQLTILQKKSTRRHNNDYTILQKLRQRRTENNDL